MGQGALVLKIGPASGLGGDDVLRLLGERGHEAQRDGEHERTLAHRDAHALERGEQLLGGVGEGDRGGCEREQRSAQKQQEEAHGVENRGRHAVRVDDDGSQLERDGPSLYQEQVDHRFGRADDGAARVPGRWR